MADSATSPTLEQSDAAQPNGPATAPNAAATDTQTPGNGTLEIDVDKLSDQQIEDLLAGKDVQIPGSNNTQPAQTNTQAAPAAKATEEAGVGEAPVPFGEAPVPLPEPETTPEANTPPERKDLRMRLNSFPDVEQEGIQLRRDLLAKGEDIPLEECLSRVRAKYAPSAKPDQAPESVANPVPTLQSEVEDIEKKLDEAGANEGLFNKEIADLTKQHARKVAELTLAQSRQADAEANAEQQARTSFQAARETARSKAVELYPDVAKPETAIGKRTRELVVELQSEDHPDHHLLLTQNAPLLVAQLAAVELGISPAAKIAPNTATTAVAEAPRVAPASGSRRTAPATPSTSEAQVLAAADKMSLEELDNLQTGGKSPQYFIRG